MALVPQRWEEVDGAWMSRALTARFPGASVASVELVLEDDGTNRRARFALTYSAGAGPATVFVKASDLEHARLNAATGGLFNEARLFRCGAELPVDHPDVFHVAIDEAHLDFVLVMEDVTARGCDPRDALRPLDVGQAGSAVRALARLHSTYWGDRLHRQPALSWVEPFSAAYRLARGIDWGMEQVADALPEDVRQLSGADIDPIWHSFAATVASGPQTLLHGDPHIGNTYVCADDDVGLLDWQVTHRGHPAFDVAYLLQGALTVDDRRRVERDLLGSYLDALEVPAAERPTPEDLWLRYRAGASYGMAVWLATAASRWQRPEVSSVLATRYARAFSDLDGASAVEDLTAA